jgi:nicotinamidase-related amidase
MAVDIADPRYRQYRWVSSVSRLFAAAMPKTVLEPKRTALFIVDMQNENCLPDAGMMTALKDVAPEDFDYYMKRLKIVVPNLQKLQSFFRTNGLEVVQCVTAPLTEDARDTWWHMLGYTLPPDSEGTKVIDELAPEPNELVLTKSTAGMFTGHNAYEVLRNMGINHLVFGGMATDTCVLATATAAGDLFGPPNIVIVEDACATFSEQDHVAGIRQMGNYKHISSTDTVIRHLTEQLEGGGGD